MRISMPGVRIEADRRRALDSHLLFRDILDLRLHVNVIFDLFRHGLEASGNEILQIGRAHV